jgi:hypothetical protein
MSKKQIRRIKRVIILWAIVWIIRSIFFLKNEVFGGLVNNVLQSITNALEENQPTQKIFEGNAMTENIYKKALNGQKRKKAETIHMSLDKLQLINKDITIDANDALNILYNSNDDIRIGIDFLNRNSKNKKEITADDIKNSYINIINILAKSTEPKILSNNNYNLVNRTKVNSRLNSQFSIASNSESFLQKFEETTIGEDLFINGVADDADYDLQIDMQNIWDLLFESFIAPIETVFYKLPQNYAGGWWSSNNKGNNSSSDKESLIALLQNTLNPSWSSTNTGIITNWWAQPSTTNNQTTTNQTSNNETTNNTTEDTTINDDWLTNFVQKNSLNQKATTQLAGIQGDVCREGVEWGPIASPEDQEEEIDEERIEEYLDTVQDQITSYDNIYPEYENIPNITNNPVFQWMTETETNQFIQEYIGDLSNVESTESCLNNCKSLPASERVVCQIQCLCFTMVWPNDPDPRVKSMNEMLKLRFCMVPAASMAIPKGKNIYSLDDILTRILANFDDVVNGWEMLKFQKTKEFLDNPIADFSFLKAFFFSDKYQHKTNFQQ